MGWEGLTAVKGYISVGTFGLPQSGSQLALRPILIPLAGVPGTAALLAWALIYAPVGVLAASCEKHRSINTSSAVQSERQETKDCHSGKQMQKKQMRHANAEGGKVPEAACLGGEQQEKRKSMFSVVNTF